MNLKDRAPSDGAFTGKGWSFCHYYREFDARQEQSKVSKPKSSLSDAFPAWILINVVCIAVFLWAGEKEFAKNVALIVLGLAVFAGFAIWLKRRSE